MIAIRLYRIYDMGREIDLDWLERSLAEAFAPARSAFLRVKPKSIVVEDPPLVLRMAPVRIEQEGRTFDFSVMARVYEIGAISLCFIHEEPEAPPKALEDIAFIFAGQEGLAGYFRDYINTLGETLRPHIKDYSVNPDIYEDYTVYVTDPSGRTLDPVPLLTGERTSISPQMREEITRNTLSYTTEDLAILSWDSALLIDPGYPTDIIDLIEFANVQVLELRYYDRELTRQMERMYDDIELAERSSRFLRSRQYHAIMAKMMENYAEISEIMEKVDNLIKVTENIYYARVYATVLRVLRSGQWTESVSRKMEVIQENYSMLSDEVRIHHSYFLEWVIIILIALEFGLAIWESFG